MQIKNKGGDKNRHLWHPTFYSSKFRPNTIANNLSGSLLKVGFQPAYCKATNAILFYYNKQIIMVNGIKCFGQVYRLESCPRNIH